MASIVPNQSSGVNGQPSAGFPGNPEFDAGAI